MNKEKSFKGQMIEYLNNWVNHLDKYDFSFRKNIVRAILNKAESIDDSAYMAEYRNQVIDEVIEIVNKNYDRERIIPVSRRRLVESLNDLKK